MRQERAEKRRNRLCAAFCAAVLLCVTALVIHALYHQEISDTDIPNDCFAQPVSDQMNEEAEETMLLKICCLTFDDGPSKNTEPILEILERYKVPATFFVTAQDVNRQYLPLVSEIAAQGHQIALHSASHEYSRIYQSTEAFWLDIKTLRQELSPVVDIDTVRWIRFPGGSTNTVSHRYGGSDIMKRLISQAEEKGYEWIDWNVCAEDATARHPNAAAILKNIQNDAKGRDLCVVLLHDTKATGQTVKALPQIVEWFQENGYHFCTIEEMAALREK